jgi:hypothetical protein
MWESNLGRVRKTEKAEEDATFFCIIKNDTFFAFLYLTNSAHREDDTELFKAEEGKRNLLR